MLTATQEGAAGEELVAACVTLSSGGDLELYKPLSDDDHTDITAGRRGKVPALAIQVKTCLHLDPKGYAVARMYFGGARPREHPAFIYAVVYVADLTVETAWVVPSADFNRLADRGKGRFGKGLELEFMASPVRTDKWSAFRCSRSELGPRLLSIVDALPRQRHAPRISGSMLLTKRTSV